MCPLAPNSVPVDLNIHSTDEEIVLSLEGRRAGDPAPNNVITEVNPFSIEPWNSPENIWYLYNSGVPRCPKGECEIKETRSGYWRPTNDLSIPTSTHAIGRKTTLEFYEGKAPFGEKTGWMMHEYQADQHTLNGYNYLKDYSSLCRIFLQTDRMTSQGEPNYSASSGDSGGEYVEHLLLGLLEQEESNFSRAHANSSQSVLGKDQALLALSGRRPDDPVPEIFAENIYETCDFSWGDYLELNDLYSLESSSVSSDNSSHMSVNSDEYFDPDALLRNIENDHGLGLDEEHSDCKFCISSLVKSNQVVIRPPPPGSINRNGDLVIEESKPGSSPVRNERYSHPGYSLSTDELRQNGQTYKASISQDSQVNQIAGSSHHGRTSQGSGLNSVCKFAKIGKKYCCFGPF